MSFFFHLLFASDPKPAILLLREREGGTKENKRKERGKRIETLPRKRRSKKKKKIERQAERREAQKGLTRMTDFLCLYPTAPPCRSTSGARTTTDTAVADCEFILHSIRYLPHLFFFCLHPIRLHATQS
nr:uncharacterized protein CTRU02_05874 [Colletotrichum truncatum]KAF6793619.1 hypothetical protein CTRU02_05874 [Colletotrichum truncatum]